MIRPVTMRDVEALHAAIYSDPAVCEPFCGKTKTLDETTRAVLEKVKVLQDSQGFGSYAVIRKADGAFIGQVLLGPPFKAHYLRLECDEDPREVKTEVELGYAFAKDCWGYGYATEAARPLIEFAFHSLGLARLITGADPDRNPRSYRLGKRLGARYVRNRHPDYAGLVGIIENQNDRGMA